MVNGTTLFLPPGSWAHTVFLFRPMTWCALYVLTYGNPSLHSIAIKLALR